jgi:hypothetical protein
MPPAHAHGTECAHVPRIEGPIVNRQIMPNQAQLRQVIGATAYDRDGDKLGNIRPIYYDNDTASPNGSPCIPDCSAAWNGLHISVRRAPSVAGSSWWGFGGGYSRAQDCGRNDSEMTNATSGTPEAKETKLAAMKLGELARTPASCGSRGPRSCTSPNCWRKSRITTTRARGPAARPSAGARPQASCQA